MAEVFSTESADQRIIVVEVPALNELILSVKDDRDNTEKTIMVDPDDLARALITASPGFAKAIGDITKRAMLTSLQEA